MPKAEDIRIDEEFRKMGGPCEVIFDEALENNILESPYGIFCPLVVWKGPGILIDGHRRWKIARKHSLNFRVLLQDFQDRHAARTWRLNQMMSDRPQTCAQVGRTIGMMCKSIEARYGLSKPRDWYEVLRRLVNRTPRWIARHKRVGVALDKLHKEIVYELLTGEFDGTPEEILALAAKQHRGRMNVLMRMKMRNASMTSAINLSKTTDTRDCPEMNHVRSTRRKLVAMKDGMLQLFTMVPMGDISLPMENKAVQCLKDLHEITEVAKDRIVHLAMNKDPILRPLPSLDELALVRSEIKEQPDDGNHMEEGKDTVIESGQNGLDTDESLD